MVGSRFLKMLYLGTTSKNRNPLFRVLDRTYNCSTDGQTEEPFWTPEGTFYFARSVSLVASF